MSKNTRVFVQWSDPKATTAYKENFRFPFLDLLRFVGKAVSEGTMTGVPCDGSCGKDKQDHLHVSPTVRDVKTVFDAFQAERPADLAFVERKLDGIAGYVARLAETNPGADFARAKHLFEVAVKELAALKTADATDYRLVATIADEVAEEANAVVLISLSEKAGSLISGLSEESKKGYEVQIDAAREAGGREGIRQLSHLVTGLETIPARLAKWGKPRSRETGVESAPAGTRSNRGTRRQENGWRPNSR